LVLEILTSLAFSWLRLAVALLLSIATALLVGISAGVNGKVERLVIPLLDVLQSVPILGFFPIAIYFLSTSIPFIGTELAAIFLIFTCTFWNIAFGVYESVRSIPSSVREIIDLARLSWTSRLTRVYLPASVPKIADQLPASIANAFYFLTASEIIVLGKEAYALKGIGVLILRSIESGDMFSVAASLAAVVLSISAAYFFVINPFISYADKYRFDIVQEHARPLRMASPRIIPPIRKQFLRPLTRFSANAHRILPTALISIRHVSWGIIRSIMIVFLIAVLFLLVAQFYAEFPDIYATLQGVLAAAASIGAIPTLEAVGFSMLRVAICVSANLAASLILVYLFVEKWGNLKEFILPLLQIVASLPAPLIFPLVAPLFEISALTREVGAILLMSLGTFWYIFYSTLGGFGRVHREYQELAEMYRISGIAKFRYIYLPFATPSIVTGLVTATGGAWNTIIVAERLGSEGAIFSVDSPGLGKLMAALAEAGELHALTYTVIVMTAVIVAINRIFWRRLYDYAVKALRIHEQQ
jgi:NitT/TauT family transport system permease protein